MNQSEDTVKDLVCGMEVNKKDTTLVSEYNGNTYYFCSPGCKTQFDENPEQYTG